MDEEASPGGLPAASFPYFFNEGVHYVPRSEADARGRAAELEVSQTREGLQAQARALDERAAENAEREIISLRRELKDAQRDAKRKDQAGSSSSVRLWHTQCTHLTLISQ